MAEKKITLDHVTNLDYSVAEALIVDFIRSKVREAGASGAVVGVSGGVDSATTLALTVRALGASNVMAVIMPDTRTTPQEDVADAKSLAESLGVQYRLAVIDRIVDSFVSALPGFDTEDYRAIGNIRARTRMIVLYYYANTENRLVVGTGDRSEYLIGYFTKWGDGAADIYPISILYKSQVRMMAKHLGLPEKIWKKPSSPRLWPGQMAEDELGISYNDIDLVLFSVFDLGLEREKVCEYTGLDCSVVDRVIEMHEKTRHKRECFPSPRLEELSPAWKGYRDAVQMVGEKK